MKTFLKLIGIGAIALAASACDEASKSNPSTAARGDLNPPTGLVSITGDTTVTLRWLGNNTEDDFKGYHVFMADGDFAGKYPAGTAWTASYPAGASLATGSIPRCKDNSAVFETNFKFPVSENDCEGDTAASGTPDAGSTLLAEEPADAPLPFVKCDGKSDANLSIPATDKVLGTQECKITGLTNGKTYTFVVMAVMGSEFENVSWSSNFVTDTPSNNIYSTTITIPMTNHVFLAHADIVAAMTGTDLTATNWLTKTTCPTDICSISGGGNLGTNAAGLYFGRNGGTKPARVYFSAPNTLDTATDSIAYLYRGGQTYDAQNPTVVSTSIPGDMANTNTEQNYTKGTLVEVLGNEVIDIAVQNAGKWHYGKLVMDVPTLATVTDEESDLTVKITLVMQPAAAIPHYFQ